jgi:hypothetical protein
MARSAMQLDAMVSAEHASLDVQPGWQSVSVTVGGTVNMR